jgi:hypothetical protein
VFAPNTTVRKTGAGTARLAGGLFFAPSGSASMENRGLIHVQQGTLARDTSSNFTFTNRGTVQVDTGATWTGNLASDGGTVRGGGTLSGAVTFTGAGNALKPGTATAPGRLSTGNLTLNPGTTFTAKLNGTVPATGYDQLAVTGTVRLDFAVLNATLGGGYTPGAGDLLFILTNDGGVEDPIDGQFAGLIDGSQVNVGGYLATISYSGDAAANSPFGGNDVVLYNFTPVPEPMGVLAVMAVACVSFLRARRKSRSGETHSGK